MRDSHSVCQFLFADAEILLLICCSLGFRATKATKSEKAAMLGKLIAKLALEAGITQVVFDRNGYLYHGKIKALADGAREGGLKL